MTKTLCGMIGSFLLVLGAIGCDDGDDRSLRHDDFSEASQWEQAEKLTLRECICGEGASFSGPFDPWPNLEDCLAENQAAIERAGEALGEEAFVLEYLAPDQPPGLVSNYWYIRGDGTGIYRWEQHCDVVPFGPNCGWHSESFDALQWSARTPTVSLCEEERLVHVVDVDFNERSMQLPPFPIK